MSNLIFAVNPFDIPDLVSMIISYLRYRELLNILMTSKIFYVHIDDCFWKRRLIAEYPAIVHPGDEKIFSFQDLYEDCFRCFLVGILPQDYLEKRNFDTTPPVKNLGALIFSLISDKSNLTLARNCNFVENDENLILKALLSNIITKKTFAPEILDDSIDQRAIKCINYLVDTDLILKATLHNHNTLGDRLICCGIDIFKIVLNGKNVNNELTFPYLKRLVQPSAVDAAEKIICLLRLLIFPDDQSRSELIIQACKNGNPDVIKVLLDDPRFRSLNLSDAFQICVENLNEEWVCHFFSPTDLNYNPSNENNKALRSLSCGTCVNTINMILCHKKFRPKGYHLALEAAAKNQNFEVLKVLISDPVMFQFADYDMIINNLRKIIAFTYGSHHIYDRLKPNLEPFGEIFRLSRADLMEKLQGFQFKSSHVGWKKRKLQGIVCEIALKHQITQHPLFRTVVMCSRGHFDEIVSSAGIPPISVTGDLKVCLLLWLHDRNVIAEKYLLDFAPLHLVNYLIWR